MPVIIDRAKWLGDRVEELCADAGYASDAVYGDLAARGITAFIPPQKNTLARPNGQAARRRCKSPPGVEAAIDRMTHGEGAIAELKFQHAIDRARYRGTDKLHIQLLLAATAINLKRLLTAPGAAQTPPPATTTPQPPRSPHTSRPSPTT